MVAIARPSSMDSIPRSTDFTANAAASCRDHDADESAFLPALHGDGRTVAPAAGVLRPEADERT